jgi:hypothetical protein
MKWPYFLQHKLKIALLLCVILIAVFVNNRVESGNITRLGSSFTAVYQDRLVVESYIFQLSNHLHDKKYLLNEIEKGDLQVTQKKMMGANNAINHLLADFEKTQLTQQEDSLLQLFKTEIGYLEKAENTFLLDPTKQKNIVMNDDFSKIFHLLAGLSAVQIQEGKTLYENSQKLVVSNASSAQLELGLIVIVGLIILALIFESKKLSTQFKQNAHLN